MTQTWDRFPHTMTKQLHFRFAGLSCVLRCSSPNSVFLSRARSPRVLHATLPLWGPPLAFTISHIHLTPRWAQIVMAVFPGNYLSKGPPASVLFMIFAFGSRWTPLLQVQFTTTELSAATQTRCKLFIHVFNRLSLLITMSIPTLRSVCLCSRTDKIMMGACNTLCLPTFVFRK